jgi:outer membrane receptor protein involved in Fe transport
MKLFFCLLFTIIYLNVSSQTITGTILSENGRTPIEKANVKLLSLPDSLPLATTASNLKGQFSFDNLKYGNYYIKVSCLGFNQVGRNIKLSGDKKISQIDTVFLSVARNLLPEVSIISKVITVKELVDRTVFTIPVEITKTSMNAYAVLQKIPSVFVDFNDKVTLNGKSNLIILVNNKQHDKEYLYRILPTDIQSIEIISSPSGKYDGELEGVINIVLKKEIQYGLRGNFETAVKQPNEISAGSGSLEYGIKKISFYLSASSNNQNLKTITTNYKQFIGNDSVNDMSGRGKFGKFKDVINSGFEYFINDKNSLSFDFNVSSQSQKTSSDNSTQIFNHDIYNKFMLSSSSYDTKGNEINASLYYQKKYAKPNQLLTIEADYYIFKSTDANSFSNSFYTSDKLNLLSSINQLEDNTNNRNSLNAKIDYVQPMSSVSRFEAGYQFYNQQINYDLKSNFEQIGNIYDYGEYRNSAYLSLFYKIGKFDFQTSLRLENSNIKINKDTSSNYAVLLPSLNILYKFKSAKSIKFTYNRRIVRPNIYDLNPYVKILSDFSLNKGNPNLRPEHHDNLKLTYTLNFGKNYISPAIYYELRTNKISQVNLLTQSPVTQNLTTLTFSDNILNGAEYGLELYGKLSFFNFSGRYFKGHINEYHNQLTSIPARNYSSYSFTNTVFLSLPYKINAYGYITYTNVSIINAERKSYGAPFYGVNLQKNVKNHSFGISYLMPFLKTVVMGKTITETSALYSKSTSGYDLGYYIQFKYAYRFFKGRDIKKLNRNVVRESDTKSGGIGM